MGTGNGRSTEERKNMSTQHVLTGTWYFAYLVLLYMFGRKHSTARHSTAPQGNARHRTAPHDVALLSYI